MTPPAPDATLLQTALQHHRAGRLADAEAVYREVLAREPGHAQAHCNLGLVCQALGRDPEAADCFQRAIALKPDYFEALANLATSYSRQGRLDEAGSCLARAIALRPDIAELHFNLGNFYSDRQRPDEAIASFRQALALKPAYVEAHYNLGTMHLTVGALDEAMSCFNRALVLQPGFALARLNLGNTLLRQGQADLAMGVLDQVVGQQPGLATACDSRLCALNYLPTSTPTAICEEHRRYAGRFETPLKPEWRGHDNSRDPDRRLKLGYVSPDLRAHSVSFFVEPLLANHDRREFEVHCYYSNTLQDAVTARLRAAADQWIPCQGLSDAQLAGRIRADGIDILVDLAGHTTGNRLLVFARKPAPVQVTYLGYPATTGLSAIDYRLVTADTDPPGAEAWHSERLYRLPRSMWCYRPLATRPAGAAATPARRSGHITFGAMNNLAKVSDGAVAAWSGILRAVPGSRLVMTGVPAGTAPRHLAARFAAHGVPPERLTLHDRLAQAEYYALLNGIDVALDPFPYNGTTTTCENLWMGVPVVTLTGASSVARSGYALLKCVGLESLAARDAGEYVAIAVALAADLARLDELRTGMRQRMADSALRDEAGLTRDIESAYRAMWREWCGIS
jgi:protein O-GlcNAc transferase